MRADQLLFEQGLAESREQAKRLIMAGKVALATSSDLPEDRVLVPKPGHSYAPDTLFMLTGQEQYVSRGAYKLLSAIEHFNLNVTDYVCLDAGSSTGGFTDCLLQHGAKKVYSIDVGKAQLHEKLLQDPRVVSMEGVNLRYIEPDILPEKVDIMVTDVSFISLTLIIPPCLPLVKSGGMVVALIKPQFEVGANRTQKGVVRDPIVRQEAVDKILNFCDGKGLKSLGVCPAKIKGPKGNQEFLACWLTP